MNPKLIEYIDAGFDIIIGKTAENSKFKIEIDCGEVYWQGIGDTLDIATENLIADIEKSSLGLYNK